MFNQQGLLKPCAFQAMGQLRSTCTAPPSVLTCAPSSSQPMTLLQWTQVDPFERKGLKPVFHFIGSRFEPRRLQARVLLSYGSTDLIRQLVQPRLVQVGVAAV
jgi:hypothetical protein